MCPPAGLCIVKCTCSLPERVEVLGAGRVRTERLNMSYLRISKFSRSWLSAMLAWWQRKNSSESMRKDAPNDADDLPRCSPDEVPHVHLPVAGTSLIGMKGSGGA